MDGTFSGFVVWPVMILIYVPIQPSPLSSDISYRECVVEQEDIRKDGQ